MFIYNAAVEILLVIVILMLYLLTLVFGSMAMLLTCMEHVSEMMHGAIVLYVIYDMRRNYSKIPAIRVAS